MPIFNQIVKGSGGGGGSGRTLEYEVVGGVLNHSTTANTIIDLTGVVGISKAYILYEAYRDNTAISGTVDMKDVKYITSAYACYSMFFGATNITSGDLSALENSVNNYSCASMFSYSGITSLDLRKLTAINGSNGMFGICAYATNLTSVCFYSLRELYGATSLSYAFEGATSLQSLSFPSLKIMGSRTNQFNGMLSGCSNVTVHFPSNMQSVIGSWSSVTGGFAGTNTTVLWDLPATVVLTGANSTNYERNPQYDTATALAWRVENPDYAPNVTVDWTPYYTAGTTDPAVSDTIYSDAACTTPVTTISSIA